MNVLLRVVQLAGRTCCLTSYFARVSSYPLELRARDVVMHETVSPETYIVGWIYDGLVTTTRRSFGREHPGVDGRDGRIVASRDYHNHVALANAVGRLSTLLSALTNEESRANSA